MNAQSVHLEIRKSVVSGTNVLTIISTCSSTNAVVEILQATDIGKTNSLWIMLAPKNVVRQTQLDLHRSRWDIVAPTNQLSIFQSRLITSATMKVAEITYDLPVNSESLFVAMLNIAGKIPFSFVSTLKFGFGQFVTEINDRKNGGGSWWTLYVNGVEHTKGSSLYVPRAGDSIEWRLENRSN